MLEAVVFLKDLQSRGLVIEVSRGVWLRAPAANLFTSKTTGTDGLTNHRKLPIDLRLLLVRFLQ